MDDLTRRDVLKLGAAATVAATVAVPEALTGQPAAAKTFFTPAELALVDELSELIIPADEHSPGARAAKVAAYIDSRLADAWDPADRTKWRDGLALIDRLSREATGGRTFTQAPADQRAALLTRMAQHEDKPTAPEEVFFGELKSRVAHAYYTSEIGIHQDMDYKGNTYLAEFVGYDARQDR
jgi:hypothetical protein